MAIEKIELDSAPKPYEILSVAKTNYRSGKRYEITVRFSWNITAAADKYQCYTDTVTLQWDRATETVADLKKKASAIFNALKITDTSEADLIFNMIHLTL